MSESNDPRKRRTSPGVTFATVRRLGLALPEAEEGTAYGTPALRVRGKLFARLREDGISLVVRTDFVERDLLLAANPHVFHITDHYRDFPWVLVRLSAVDADELGSVLENSWRRAAPKRLVAQLKPHAPARRARKAKP